MTSTSIRRHAGPLATALCAAFLAACGGGGDSPAPEAPGDTTPPPTASATCGFSGFATNALARVNQWRASGANCGSEGQFGPAPAIAWNDRLTQAATAHSQDMQANNFFSHTGSSGSTLAQRVDATGYAWSAIGENIAAGQTSINSVVDGWIGSPGHCRNIMNPNFTQMGLACVPGGSGNTYSTYWTMDLGRPQ
jgi:uncharacterized protein YkwD